MRTLTHTLKFSNAIKNIWFTSKIIEKSFVRVRPSIKKN